MKKCSKCKNLLSISEFYLNRKKRGYQGYCKACHLIHCSTERSKSLRRAAYKRKPERVIVTSINARLRKLGIEGSFTLEEWLELKASYGNRCIYCGVSSLPLEIDHIWPISLSANKTDPCNQFVTNYIENVVPACNFCNRAKQNKSLLLFLAWKSGRLE